MFTLALVCGLALINPAKPQLSYTLVVDTADLTHIALELHIQNAPPNLTLAAAAHPEYDDRYWRYIEDFAATDMAGNAIAFTRPDSVLWRLASAAGDVTVRYRLRIPAEALPRAAWRPFLTRTGGLVGGPHSFLYVLNAERLSARLTVDVPPGWRIATALESSATNTFSAPDLQTLMESPLQVGPQSEWRFDVRGVPHRVFYWRLPNATPFDTTRFMSSIQRIAGEAIALFGGAPYRTYTFLFQDGAYGGLEHPASVTLGVPSAALASDPNSFLVETAHEFFHTWNLMHIQPVEYRGLEYTTQPPVAELWFSEGLTLFYADLLLRRAGLPAAHPTRGAHLESLIARYLASPGHSRFSAERISNVAYNAGPGALGDYSASVHLVGELIGTVLDLRIRAETDGAGSMDDVMRLMNQRFATRGFASADVQTAMEEICACNVADVFDRYVYAAGAIDFNRYLSPLGLRINVRWEPAREANGRPMTDLRIYAYNRQDEDGVRLVVTDPASAWGRAGLHTHDRLVSLNGKTIGSWSELRTALTALTLGDTVGVTVQQNGVPLSVKFALTGYDRPVVRVEEIPEATPDQRRLLEQWRAAR